MQRARSRQTLLRRWQSLGSFAVFVLPGLGSLLLSSVARHDLMVVQGIVMLLVLAVLVINALVEVSYVFIDPRLRTRSR